MSTDPVVPISHDPAAGPDETAKEEAMANQCPESQQSAHPNVEQPTPGAPPTPPDALSPSLSVDGAVLPPPADAPVRGHHRHIDPEFIDVSIIHNAAVLPAAVEEQHPYPFRRQPEFTPVTRDSSSDPVPVPPDPLPPQE